jgi:hypothetical protein
MANAINNHPEAVAELVSGLFLMGVGTSGEAAGVALDASGAGAAVGVPVGAVSAGAISTGAGLVAKGGGTLWLNAAGDDRVTPMGNGSGGLTSPEIESANYAQKTASRAFSKKGDFRQTIDDVAGNCGWCRKMCPLI